MQRVVEKHRKTPPPVPFKVTGTLQQRLDEEEDGLASRDTAILELVAKSFHDGGVLEPFTVDAVQAGLQDAAARAEVLDAWLPQEGMQRAPVKLNLKVCSIPGCPTTCSCLSCRLCLGDEVTRVSCQCRLQMCMRHVHG